MEQTETAESKINEAFHQAANTFNSLDTGQKIFVGLAVIVAIGLMITEDLEKENV